ncbi:MAG: DUF3089 domain-containing protein [Chitinophagaceae bacterium]|nr:DUF3089 domain-containing protein [Chitinophagaceae bacterium]
MIRFCLLAVFVCLFTSCSDKYQAFRDRYQFKAADGKPDYASLDYWAAHPWKWDPSDSVPRPLKNEARDSIADVFFLHPTTYTSKKITGSGNAPIDDAYLNAKTDYSTILYQASAFNQQSRVFAPRYRQTHFDIFFSDDEKMKAEAFELAYADVSGAFHYYLTNWNKGRPIIIASHSQGSKFAERLLKEYFEDKPLSKQLVVAYVIGWAIPKEFFSSLRMCADSIETGCVCGWRTLRNGFIPYYLKNEKGNSYVSNPLTWKLDEEYASRKLNNGSVLFKFNKVYRRTTDARTGNGFLFVRRPKFPWSFLYFTKNYHVGDINLFYMNIRTNLRQRILAFQNK